MKNLRQALKADHEGVLAIGGIQIPCAVLSDGQRLLTAQGIFEALGRAKRGSVDGLPHFLAADNLKPWISPEISRWTNPVRFTRRAGGWAYGFRAELLPATCAAYLAARRAGALRENQAHVAERCEVLLAALATVGVVALIDEATGYQKVRAADELQVKLAAYICAELRRWSKLFPDELWAEFARLERRATGVSVRPKYWGAYVREVIYDALDPDVAAYLRQNRPPSSSRRRLHQWLTEDFGAVKLREHIQQVIAIARTCSTMREFRGRVALSFRRGPAQSFLPLQSAA